MVLCTFPKAFSKGRLPNVLFFQVVISQMCNFPSANFLKVRLGPLRRNLLQKGGGAGDAAMIDLGIFRLGNCTFGKIATWEKSFGKVPTIEEIKNWSEKVNEWEEKQK